MPPSRPESGSILIVDVHCLTAALVGELLRGAFPGRPLHMAANAMQGISHFLQFDPSVVVLDIDLPDGSGLELTRRLAALNSMTPILVYSLADSEVMKQGAVTAGARAFVSKARPRELVPMVCSLLAGAP